MLTLVVNTVLQASRMVSKEELQAWSEDDSVIQRWRKNPLGGFMRVLAATLETESKSAENRRKQKEQASKRPTPTDPRSYQTIREVDIPLLPPPAAAADIISTLTISSVSDTAGSIISQHKRTASSATTASYGASSTESPPQNIDQPEPHVQRLQNVFVDLLTETIWGVGVPVS